jgi:hypothetical protein
MKKPLDSTYKSSCPILEQFCCGMMWSVHVASKIAEALEVSVDFLLGKTATEIDKQTLKRLQDIAKLAEEDKKNIFYTLDGLIRAAKLKTL